MNRAPRAADPDPLDPVPAVRESAVSYLCVSRDITIHGRRPVVRHPRPTGAWALEWMTDTSTTLSTDSMYDRILLPTDGSVGTAHVALQAIDLAAQYGARVYVLHVIDADLRSQVGQLAGVGEELESRGRRAVERVERMVAAHGIDVVTALEDGDPAATIVEYADDIDADLIVAGTHGRSGVERRLVGSVTERLVRLASCPVLTVRLPDTDVTVDDAERARDIASDALGAAGLDATVTTAGRQENVWVVEATAEGTEFVVYLDPVTRRTSIIRRE